ncbi:MAG: hypothetical protein IPM07_26895 [Anaerolineales bacterium]|nr:hypothetical protein [Anaerolineales bacterium]
MALAAAVKGGLRPSQIVTWQQDSGTVWTSPATLTGTITNRSSVTRAIAGALTVTDGAGQFRWDYAAGDVARLASSTYSSTPRSQPGRPRARSARWTVRDYRTVTA